MFLYNNKKFLKFIYMKTLNNLNLKNKTKKIKQKDRENDKIVSNLIQAPVNFDNFFDKQIK